MILSNQIECLKCGDQPYSAHRHDSKWCSCGNMSVDGGMDYLKRSGSLKDFRELSISLDDKLVEELTLSINDSLRSGRNGLGILCSIAITLRDNGYKIEEVNDV